MFLKCGYQERIFLEAILTTLSISQRPILLISLTFSCQPLPSRFSKSDLSLCSLMKLLKYEEKNWTQQWVKLKNSILFNWFWCSFEVAVTWKAKLYFEYAFCLTLQNCVFSDSERFIVKRTMSNGYWNVISQTFLEQLF